MDIYRIGQRLKQLRLKAGLRQAAVAELLGVTHVTVSYIERGRIQTPLDRLMKFAQAVGGHATLLITDQSDPRDQLLARLMAVIPHVPERQLRAMMGLLEVWEEMYLPVVDDPGPAE